MSEAFSVPLHFKNTLLHDLSNRSIFGPRVKFSPSETMNLVAPFTVHCKLSVCLRDAFKSTDLLSFKEEAHEVFTQIWRIYSFYSVDITP